MLVPGARDDVPQVAYQILEVVKVGVEDLVEEGAEFGVGVVAHDFGLVFPISGEPRAQGRLVDIEVASRRIRGARIASAEDNENV